MINMWMTVGKRLSIVSQERGKIKKVTETIDIEMRAPTNLLKVRRRRSIK